MTIEKLGENITKQDPSPANRVDAVGGDLIRFTLNIRSDSSTRLTNLVVRDVLPAELIYEAGSTKVNNAAYPDGITGNGISIGALDPLDSVSVTFLARVKSADTFQTGTTVLVNAGYARADGVSERESKLPLYITKNIIISGGAVQTGVDGATAALLASLVVTFGYHFAKSGLTIVKGKILGVVAILFILLASSFITSNLLEHSEITSIEIRSPVVRTEQGNYFGLIGR